MENVTLTAVAFSMIKKAFVIVCVIVSCLILLLHWSGGAEIGMTEVVRALIASITVAAFLFWIFYQWCWKWGSLPSWLGRPVVNGVWIGQLESNYGQGENQNPLKIDIVFVVRQTYLTLCIQSFTAHQVGESKVEALIQNKRTNSTRLAYVYELKNEYDGRSTLINGAGDLSLIIKHSKDMVLKGAYWTSSPTQGSLTLHRVSENCDGIGDFSDALKRWPKGPLWKISKI